MHVQCISVVITLCVSHVSLVFDDEEENKLSYTEIHQQYKQLVSHAAVPKPCLWYLILQERQRTNIN